MRITDNRKMKEATLFCELNVGDVFEKLNSADDIVWIKVLAENDNTDEDDSYNAFILSNNTYEHRGTCAYRGSFNANTPVRKLNVELTILGEEE